MHRVPTFSLAVSAHDLEVSKVKLYFAANDGNGSELWQYDYASGVASLAIDINPTGGSNPQELVTMNDKLYMSATDGVHGSELMEYDPVTKAIRLIKDFNPGAASSIDYTNYLTVVGDKIFMSALDVNSVKNPTI